MIYSVMICSVMIYSVFAVQTRVTSVPAEVISRLSTKSPQANPIMLIHHLPIQHHQTDSHRVEKKGGFQTNYHILNQRIRIFSHKLSLRFQMSINVISRKKWNPDHCSFCGRQVGLCAKTLLVNIKVTYLQPAHLHFNLKWSSKLNSKDASGFGSKGQWTFVNWFHWKEFQVSCSWSDIYSLCIF